MVSRLFVAAILTLGYCALAAPADGPLFNCASTPSAERVAAVETHFAKYKETGPSTEGNGGVIQFFSMSSPRTIVRIAPLRLQLKNEHTILLSLAAFS